jgi:hypothetical protein
VKYKDYYAALEVPRDADADTLKKAYRRLARKYHPDVSAEAGADSVALLASTAERVWVRVNNQRTVVLAIGQELPGYGRLLAVQGGRARFEKATLSERAP